MGVSVGKYVGACGEVRKVGKVKDGECKEVRGEVWG